MTVKSQITERKHLPLYNFYELLTISGCITMHYQTLTKHHQHIAMDQCTARCRVYA